MRGSVKKQKTDGFVKVLFRATFYLFTAKKAMEYKRFSNCLTNARQKNWYVFGQKFTDLVYVDRHHSLLTTFVPRSI